MIRNKYNMSRGVRFGLIIIFVFALGCQKEQKSTNKGSDSHVVEMIGSWEIVKYDNSGITAWLNEEASKWVGSVANYQADVWIIDGPDGKLICTPTDLAPSEQRVESLQMFDPKDKSAMPLDTFGIRPGQALVVNSTCDEPPFWFTTVFIGQDKIIIGWDGIKFLLTPKKK